MHDVSQRPSFTLCCNGSEGLAYDFECLKLYLRKLPPALPYRTARESDLDFTRFADDDFVKEEGVNAAVNRQLE